MANVAPDRPTKSRSPWQHLTLGAGLLVAVLGLVLRWQALSTSFWLDEIWSWHIAAHLDHWTDAFSAIHHDNNHYLNTLWIWCCGEQPDWAIYREVSFVAGFVTIVLAAAFCSRQSSGAGWIALLLFGASTLLTIYASEARGYALAGAAAVGVLLVLQADQQRMSYRWGALFAVIGCLGFLAHLSFFQVYAGTIAWSLVAASRLGWTQALLRLFAWHAPAGLMLATLYLVDLRYLSLGVGASRMPIDLVLRDIAAATFGEADEYTLLTVAGVLLHAATFAHALRFWKRDRAWAALYLVAIWVAPLTLALLKAENMYARYFFIAYVVWLTWLSQCAAEWLELPPGLLGRPDVSSPAGKISSSPAVVHWRSRGTVALLALITACNLLFSLRFVQLGRGQFPQVLRTITQLPPGTALSRGATVPPVRVLLDAGKQPLFEMECRFYGSYVPFERPIEIYEVQDAPSRGGDFIVAQSVRVPGWPLRTMMDRSGRRYRLIYADNHSRLVSWNWALYAPQEAASTTEAAPRVPSHSATR